MGQRSPQAPQVHEGRGVQEVGDAAGIHIRVPLHLPGQLALVVPGPGEQAPPGVGQLELGRSFGILIALRTVKTNGLYSLVRHPMYGTDILLRIGFVVGHFNLFTIFLFVISTGAYIARAMLEEQFLLQDEAYQEYVRRVKYRFIPFVF